MSAKPTDLTAQPPLDQDPSHLLRDGLRCLQMSGAIFLRAHFTAPWAYASPSAEQFDDMLQPRGRRIVLFHIFTEGRCRLALPGGPDTEICGGDIVILPFANAHLVGDPSVEHPVPVGELMPRQPWVALPVIRHGGGGAPTSMVCGYLFSDDLPFNPVLSSLPPFMRVRPSGSGPLAKWVDASVQYALHAAEQRGAEDDLLLQRLPELLFMECLCEVARQEPDRQEGWLAALVDPIVGRAMACMHRDPAHKWTLEELARRAASSRSVLDERFRTVLGRAPMSYLTSWRLQLASRQLRTTGAALAEIAEATGYGSEASLSRAFKREAGMSPGQWRQAVGERQ